MVHKICGSPKRIQEKRDREQNANGINNQIPRWEA